MLERVAGNVLSDDNQARLLAHGILQCLADGIAVIQCRHLVALPFRCAFRIFDVQRATTEGCPYKDNSIFCLFHFPRDLLECFFDPLFFFLAHLLKVLS